MGVRLTTRARRLEERARIGEGHAANAQSSRPPGERLPAPTQMTDADPSLEVMCRAACGSCGDVGLDAGLKATNGSNARQQNDEDE